MKRYIICRRILSSIIIFSVFSYAITNVEYEKIILDSYKNTLDMKIRHYDKKINDNVFKITFKKINTWINKNNEKDTSGKLLLNYQDLVIHIFQNDIEKYKIMRKGFLPYGQQVNIFMYKINHQVSFLIIMVRNGDTHSKIPWFVHYTPYIFEIKNQNILRKKNIEKKYFYSSDYFKTITTDEEKEYRKIYPFYNKQTILAQLKKVIQNDLILIQTNLKLKNNISKYTLSFFNSLIEIKSIDKITLTPYNNIAYYLQKAGANEEAAYLLEKIIAKFPNRTVAYYNLGDAYWELGEKKKAIKAYTTYIEQMCHKGLQKKIPKKVLERVKDKR